MAKGVYFHSGYFEAVACHHLWQWTTHFSSYLSSTDSNLSLVIALQNIAVFIVVCAALLNKTYDIDNAH